MDIGRFGPVYGIEAVTLVAALRCCSCWPATGRWPRCDARVDLQNVSRWYGNVVAVNDISMTLEPGVTGLLGPNGAGKTTVLHMMAGFLAPSRGTVDHRRRADLAQPGRSTASSGLVTEREAVHGFLTAWEFVAGQRQDAQAARPGGGGRRGRSKLVEMTDAQDRRIETYSKGMRQRTRVAAALVHDPQVLLLDEPFNGMDPRQRMHMMEPAARARRPGPHDPVQLAHPGGGRAGLRHGPGDRGRPAGRLRRLPQDPPADDQPAARLRRAVAPTTGGWRSR